MSDNEYDRIAEALAERLKHHKCPLGFDQDTVTILTETAQAIKQAREKAWGALVYAVVIGCIGLICAGFWAKLK